MGCDITLILLFHKGFQSLKKEKEIQQEATLQLNKLQISSKWRRASLQRSFFILISEGSKIKMLFSANDLWVVVYFPPIRNSDLLFKLFITDFFMLKSVINDSCCLESLCLCHYHPPRIRKENYDNNQPGLLSCSAPIRQEGDRNTLSGSS